MELHDLEVGAFVASVGVDLLTRAHAAYNRLVARGEPVPQQVRLLNRQYEVRVKRRRAARSAVPSSPRPCLEP
jgi:hypothetical protein